MKLLDELGILNLTLPDMLEQTCKRFPERSAVYFYGREIDYRTLFGYAQRFAAALSETGIEKGDRVAIMLPNCPQYVIAYYGILMAGGIVVQVNPMSVEREIEHYLTDSGAKAMVVYAPLLPRLAAVPGAAHLRKKIIVELPPAEKTYDDGSVGFESFVASAAGPAPQPELSADEVAVLQYTGGTTGRSKGAMLTHRNLVVNAYQSHILMGGNEQEQERILTVIPLFHVYGMTVAMNGGIVGGGQLVMLPRFDLEEVLQTIQATKPTLFPGVPTMYVAINSHPQAEEYGISSIRLCVSGSAPMPVEVMHEFERKTNGTIIEGYGLSEASPVTHFNPIEKRKPGSIGTPIAFTEAKIVDLADGTTELPPNQPGELVIRGPQVMKGYWNMPDETAATIRDGWLYTGDIAKMDEDGYFYIIDRKKDMIIASGYNIYPRDVEEVLYQHPAVQEAVVVGVPDQYRGETVKAVVVVKQGRSLTEEELIAFCREKLAAYKVPRIVEFRTELPKTAVGKILRRALREEARQSRQQA
ncbi:long-chain-fatty-acid--CoA ligase [Effusibacillus pohliae]|uniref:long-chain-fatty-acid--CoA ligase n=1 Tax=Effusibacillus pohliae TaxID=232270 RepID=UPI00035E34FD|nr:long-chain fatty acid--CoA ligase [Effusibacillus pohliae]